MAPLRYAAKFDPFLSLDCAPTSSTLAQSKERKGSNFAIWQPRTQSYNFSFFISGGFLIAAAVVSEIADILYGIDQRRRSKERDDSKECEDFTN